MSDALTKPEYPDRRQQRQQLALFPISCGQLLLVLFEIWVDPDFDVVEDEEDGVGARHHVLQRVVKLSQVHGLLGQLGGTLVVESGNNVSNGEKYIIPTDEGSTTMATTTSTKTTDNSLPYHGQSFERQNFVFVIANDFSEEHFDFVEIFRRIGAHFRRFILQHVQLHGNDVGR